MVDVLHVEDDDCVRACLKVLLEGEGKSYAGTSTLSDFCASMREDHARVYVLDGCFPMRHQEGPRLLADRACKEIRRVHSDAKIIVYSNHDNLLALAETLNVVGLSKSVYSESAVVQRVLELMGTD